MRNMKGGEEDHSLAAIENYEQKMKAEERSLTACENMEGI